MARGIYIFKIIMIDDVTLWSKLEMVSLIDFINPLMGTGNYSAHRII